MPTSSDRASTHDPEGLHPLLPLLSVGDNVFVVANGTCIAVYG